MGHRKRTLDTRYVDVREPGPAVEVEPQRVLPERALPVMHAQGEPDGDARPDQFAGVPKLQRLVPELDLDLRAGYPNVEATLTLSIGVTLALLVAGPPERLPQQ